MEIKDIKASLSILQVLSLYDLKPDRNKRFSCPFHDDKTPSMQVYPETNTVYCFSTNCELHGKAVDQIDFLMKKEGVTKHEALKKAAELCGEIKIEPSLADRFHSMRSSLLKSKKAQQYLSDRNLSPNQEIGFNSYQSGYKQLQNCIIFPLRDKSGKITSLYSKSMLICSYSYFFVAS